MTESQGFFSDEGIPSFTHETIRSMLYEKEINNSLGMETLRKIVCEAQKYDIGDLLSKVAALNLLIENQNKSIFFDSVIAALISQPLSYYLSKKRIKTNELRKLISQIAKTGLSMGIDPPEVLFIDRVRFYGNYWIFPGINYIPAYVIQKFIDVLVHNEKMFDATYFQIVIHIINFVLNVSNDIANALNYGHETQKKTDKKHVQIPDYIKMQEISSLLIFNIDNLIDILKIDYSEFLFSGFEETKLEDVLGSDIQHFYQHPFIKTDNNTCVLLNPTMLIPFAVHQIILEADRFGQKETLINLYNEYNWKDCIFSLSKLGHKKIQEDSIDISLFSSDNYKESLFSVGYNSIIWVSFYCDDGKNYSKDSIFGDYTIAGNTIPKQQQKEAIEKKLAEKKIVCVGHITILCSFGRQIIVHNIHNNKTSMRLDPCELHYISINESTCRCYLPQYIKAKSKIKNTYFSTISELNAIEIYDSNNHSFYMDDNFKLSETVVYFTIGDSLDYIVRATRKEDRRLIDAGDDIHLEDVVLYDKSRGIYIPYSLGRKIKYAILVRNCIIWLWADKPHDLDEYNIIMSLLDALSFWLAECYGIIESLELHEKVYNIQISLSGEIIQYP